MFIICLSPLSYFNIFLVRLSLGLDWVGTVLISSFKDKTLSR